MAEQGERNARRARVSQAIRDHLSQMLARDVRDPRVRKIGLISINTVELNRDMSTARIYVSFMGADDRAIHDAMLGLEASATFLRGPIGRRINLSRAPLLRFVHDRSPEFKYRLAEIIAEDERQPVEDISDASDGSDGSDGSDASDGSDGSDASDGSDISDISDASDGPDKADDS